MDGLLNETEYSAHFKQNIYKANSGVQIPIEIYEGCKFVFRFYDIWHLLPFLKVGGSATVTLRLICFFKTIETGIIILLDSFTFCEIKKGFWLGHMRKIFLSTN